MIVADLGLDLAGRTEPRLRVGAAWSVASALFEALPYGCLYYVLMRLQAGAGSIRLAVAVAAMLAICALLLVVCKAHANIANFGGIYALVADARLRIADGLSQLPMGLFAKQRQAAIAELLTGRYAHYQDIVARVWGLCAVNASLPVFLLGIMCLVDLELALVAGLLAPLAFVAIPWSHRLLTRAHASLAELRLDTVAHVVEHVAGIRELRVFDPQARHLARTEALLHDLEHAQLRAELAPAPALLAFGFLLQVGLAATAMLGCIWLAPGQHNAAVLLVFLVLALRFFRAWADLGLNLAELRHARDTLRDIRALAAEPTLAWPETGREPADATLVFDQVRFQHEGASRPAIHDVSGTVLAGSLLALVGPSGSGKSTLASLIARMWDPQSGVIRLGGQDLRNLPADMLNRQVSMVQQDVMLFQGTIADNIALGAPNASRESIHAAARAARAHDFIQSLPQGYDTVLGPGGAGLSGGERQRIAIARALVKNAPVLVLDEATASVDPDNEWDIQQALDTLTRGRTVIVIAHRLPTIRQADQIWVMDQGRIAEQGTHASLLAQQGLYTRLWSQYAAGT